MPRGQSLKIRGYTPRAEAARVLLRLHQSASGQMLTVQELLQALPLFPDARDTALCTELVYGTLRQLPRLEWLLDRQLRQPGKLPLPVRIILLGAIYELLYLDRIPPHATVNQAVEAVRMTAPGLEKLANAVLRSLESLGQAPFDPAWYAAALADPIRRIAVEHAVPAWMVGLWTKAYSLAAAEALARASCTVPWPALRLNRSKADWQDTRSALLAGGGHPVGQAGVAFATGGIPDQLSGLIASGQASWQGAGSQLVLEELDAAAWEGPIWDACAGRGGKTCALLEQGKDVHLASDPHPRIRGLAAETARLGLPCPDLERVAARQARLSFTPATVVLDAPCSGLGTLARRPDIRLNRTETQLAHLVAVQADLVDTVWEALRPGGRLVYITCTVNPAENEKQMERLHALHPDAVLEKESRPRSNVPGADLMYGAVVRKV